MTSTHPLLNPFLESMGITLDDWSAGHAEFRMPMTPRFGNRSGRIQGGVICTLLDAAGGYAGLYAAPGAPELHSVTLSLTSNFLDSGEGGTLKAIGRLQRKGRSIYFARSEVWLDDDLLLATAIGTFKYLKTGR